MREFQRQIHLKGTCSHDSKFSPAVRENYHRILPQMRDCFIAANALWLQGSGKKNPNLVARARAAMD